MADGRMLKRAISDSRRLADLKNDATRLLYTWLIPWLDIEGRFSADPWVIKGKVVPRLKNFGIGKIESCLSELAASELINLYEFDGDRYLELRKFKDHQNLRPGKEAESQIPDPKKADSRPTPAQLPPNSGVSKEKLREEKLREVSSQITDLLKQFPESIQNSIKIYWDRARMKNKSQTITDGRRLTMLRELWNSFSQCEDKAVFEKALEGAIKYDAPNINYLNAIVRSEKCPKP